MKNKIKNEGNEALPNQLTIDKAQLSIEVCPGTLSPGHISYSQTCLKRMFQGKKVSHVLPYDSPATNEATDELFLENRTRTSLSGVQEKFSVLLEKNKLRLIREGEQGGYILKPIPGAGKQPDQMPANEHLTMQIARQVFDIETAENAMIFFKNGEPAYITKRFDNKADGSKWASEDFASLAGRTPQTHGKDYKYLGNYLELFGIMKRFLSIYQIEAPKLFTLILFNYLFSNGDAHVKNFSLLETPLGDYKLSPAYDLLNSHLHVNDTDFALDDGLLPKNQAKGKIMQQFRTLGENAEIHQKIVDDIIENLLSKEESVKELTEASFLKKSAKLNYLQAYQTRLNKLTRPRVTNIPKTD